MLIENICFAQELELKPDPSGAQTRIINVLLVDDMQAIRSVANISITPYNKRRVDNPEIHIKFLDDGSKITLENLLGVNLVLCDISMPEPGPTALARIMEEAKTATFSLPPFVAITSESAYQNIGEEDPEKQATRLDYATKQHFIGGRDKVSILLPIDNILKYCDEKLGPDWLTTHVGQYKPVNAAKKETDLEPTESSITVDVHETLPIETSWWQSLFCCCRCGTKKISAETN
ncbi:MAG: response regulator [Alphaproteobacteria bacterium]